MNNPLISIIVPVYNVEKYLEKCVNSILNQSYKNIEIILVNDGSKDNSGYICDNFKKLDKRVRVFHTKNHGVSHARNIGLDNIKGEYYLFIDSDDYIKNTMIENLLNNAFEYNADISICNVVKVDEEGNIIFEPKILNEVVTLDKIGFVKYLYNRDYINGYPINKLIKTSCTMKVRFDEGIRHLEDWDYLCRLSTNVNTVVYDGRSYYYYYVNRKTSAVHDKFNEAWTTDLIARKKNINCIKYYNEYDRDRFYFDYIVNALNTLGFYHLQKKLTENKKRELLEIKNRYYSIVIKSNNISKKEKIKLYIKCKCPIFYFKLMELLKK